MMSIAPEKLVAAAREASARAYAPYSGFKVGAALVCEDEALFTGCNVENASYGLTVCAERAAVFAAVAAGERRFRALAVYADAGEPVPPCGACLQVLSEFADDLTLYLAGRDGGWREARLRQLYPEPFGRAKLEGRGKD
jgi:cytidine deaminase